MPIWEVILLGLIEGLTEFLPVSSTGHLLLTEHFLGICTPGKTFEVLIQLGAILAILSVYFVKLTRIALALPYDPRARRFVISVLLAFLPAAVIGALAHDFIKTVLFETPMLIAVMLIVGGIVLLFVDRMQLAVHYTDAMDYPASARLQDRPFPVPRHDPRRIALGRHHRRRHAARHRQALGGGVLVLPRHADDGRRIHLRPL